MVIPKVISNNFLWIKIYCYAKPKYIILIHRLLLNLLHNPRNSAHIFPTVQKFEYSLAVELRLGCPKTLTHSCLECLVLLVILASHLILHKTKEMVVGGCQMRTVRRVRENFPPHVLNFFQGQTCSVRLSVAISSEDYGHHFLGCRGVHTDWISGNWENH